MNIFVSNLSSNTNDGDLRSAFEEYGNVFSAKVINDKYTGQSRGFGFVEMGDNDGQKAIEALNGATFDEKVINVAVARPKTDDRYQSNNRQYGNRNNRGGGYRNNDRY
ncbi:MAG: RNA-binding protein [Bacteroidales bacterium]|jgi:RNA recognition motif-containing protein|nr:RNA-binding protein [Bacteroidales bacterium]